MAQKARKTLAQKNSQTLNRTHLIALGVNAFYLLLSLFVFRRRNQSLLKYVTLNAPALLVEFWFERIARPTYTEQGDYKQAGEDLDAKGLTEWMWDILYWTWGNVLLVALAGDWAWWAMLLPVGYSIWLAFTTYNGVRSGMGGLMGGATGADASSSSNGQSKRQAKIEKRGGQRVQYR